MALLGGFKLNKAIDTLLMADQKGIVEVKEALVKIKDAGDSAVPKLIEALVDDPNNTYINKLLFELLSNQTLSEYIDALADVVNITLPLIEMRGLLDEEDTVFEIADVLFTHEVREGYMTEFEKEGHDPARTKDRRPLLPWEARRPFLP